ncbi:MAG: hypothetical protein GYB68_08575 [Chloroflexi bacterium]|nr:hypothetical protein [Chloroflexota bacterium]
MFDAGVSVVHPSYGAGVIRDVKKMSIAGTEHVYYNIELVDGDMLMLPVKQAEETGLRQIVVDMDLLEEVLTGDPNQLSKNHRTRRANMTEKIHSGDPAQVIEALRDLVWRGQNSNLSAADAALKLKAKQMLIGEMALRLNVSVEEVAERIDRLLKQLISDNSLPQ